MDSDSAIPPSISLQCKTFLFYRCLVSVALSVLLQIKLLLLFLLFINFDLLHPIAWISSIIARLFSFYTWLALIPLLAAVVLYFMILQKTNLSVKKYYDNRVKWLIATAMRKVIFLCLQVIIGVLTAWLYARYLHMDYKQLVNECFGRRCLSSYYMFLILAGLSAACYHFFKEHLRKEPELEFPIIQEKKFVQIRSLMYFNLYRTLVNAIMPTAYFTLAYWLLGNAVNVYFAKSLNVETDERLDSILEIVGNVRLLFYGWLLTSHIITNLQLMQNFASIVMTEEVDFLIERNPLVKDSAELTLVDALTMKEFPIIQQLAALNFYKLSLSKSNAKRQEMFVLSLPGGHPYNWNQLSTKCLMLLNDFTQQLAAASKNISTMKISPLYSKYEPNDKFAAEKILLRQYNLMHGIRNIADEPQRSLQSHDINYGKDDKGDVRGQVVECFEKLTQQFERACQSLLFTVPGVHYLFAEEDGAKVSFLLSNSQAIVWIAQALAGICAASLTEDKYGVVQDTLRDIIRTFLQLKLELDRLNNVNLSGKKLDRNFYVLKQSIKRSLYKITDAFGNYIGDVLTDPDDVRNMQAFLFYQET